MHVVCECKYSVTDKDSMALQAVILAAGSGSRIRALTEDTPKALLPIANMPMIWYPLQLLEKAKFTG